MPLDGTLIAVPAARAAITKWTWRYRHLMLAGATLLLYLVGLGRPPLWEPDEGRYAEIAREMVTSHDYMTPHNNFVRYFEKPPLVYWMTAASLKLLGRNEFAVRLQAATASVGEVLITGALGETMFGATTGMLAGLMLALSPLFFAFARFATPDPALSFFVAAAMMCFYLGIRSSDAGGGIHAGWMLAAAAMLALGTLTKGPVALLLSGGIALLWLLLEGRWRAVFRFPWVWCIGIYLAITLPWFVVVARRNPGFIRFFLVHEHFQRYFESTEHGWGPWFYIPITVAGTWPWFYFVPFALLPLSGARLRWLPLKKTRSVRPASKSLGGLYADRVDENTRAALRFLVIWFAVVLIFFSIPRSKLGEYILPGLPPIGILAAYGFARINELSALQRQRIFLLFASINFAAAAALTAATFVAPSSPFTDPLTSNVRIVGFALLAVGITSALFASRTIAAIGFALATSVLIEMAAAMNARQKLSPLVSYRELARIIAPYANRRCALMSYGHFEQGLPFYTGDREILVDYRGELQPFGPRYDPNGTVFATLSQLRKRWRSGQCTVLIVNRSDLPRLARLLSPPPALIGHEGKKVALYNRMIANNWASLGCKDL